jgi:hypothetical protein
MVERQKSNIHTKSQFKNADAGRNSIKPQKPFNVPVPWFPGAHLFLSFLRLHVLLHQLLHALAFIVVVAIVKSACTFFFVASSVTAAGARRQVLRGKKHTKQV